jgi:hypothetical protein
VSRDSKERSRSHSKACRAAQRPPNLVSGHA